MAERFKLNRRRLMTANPYLAYARNGYERPAMRSFAVNLTPSDSAAETITHVANDYRYGGLFTGVKNAHLK
jgi:hypothetical protein